MEILSIFLILYGILCLFIGVTKMPLIWKMKKFEIMAKMFKGDRNLQIFVIVWGLVAFVVGILIR